MEETGDVVLAGLIRNFPYFSSVKCKILLVSCRQKSYNQSIYNHTGVWCNVILYEHNLRL